MRSEDDVIQAQQGGAEGERFYREDVQACVGDLVRAKRVYQGSLVDDLAPGDVDKDRARFHLPELGRPEHVVRTRCEREVDGDDVRPGQQFIEMVRPA